MSPGEGDVCWVGKGVRGHLHEGGARPVAAAAGRGDAPHVAAFGGAGGNVGAHPRSALAGGVQGVALLLVLTRCLLRLKMGEGWGEQEGFLLLFFFFFPFVYSYEFILHLWQ